VKPCQEIIGGLMASNFGETGFLLFNGSLFKNQRVSLDITGLVG
jgi:hypothetical protein